MHKTCSVIHLLAVLACAFVPGFYHCIDTILCFQSPLYLFVYVWPYVFSGMFIHVNMHVEVEFPKTCPTCFLKQALFLYPKIFNLANLAGQKVPEILLFQLPSAGIISNHSFQLFKWVLGIKFKSLCYYVSHLSGLILMLSFNLILFNCPTKTAVLFLLRGNFQKWDFIPEIAKSSLLVRD